MDNLLTRVDTTIKEIEYIYCIEASPLEHIAYVAGYLTSKNARQSCPVLVIDLLSHKVIGKNRIL